MENLTANTPSVQSHLTILQDVIGRMAANSAASKTWCITIVSALLVVVADKTNTDYALLAFIPVFLFLFLDSYYLALERGFRISYNGFIRKLHRNEATVEDIFIVSLGGGVGHILALTTRSLFSLSIWPFYLVLGMMVYAAKVWIL